MQLLQHRSFEANPLGRDFITGDIHGQLDHLLTQLNEVDFNFQKDRLFALGDLIDRGNQSEECLDLLNKSWFFSVLGNHEYVFLDQVQQHNLDTSNLKLGNQWLDKWKVDEEQLSNWSKLIKSTMPVYISIKYPSTKIGLVHAKPPVNWPLEDSAKISSSEAFNDVWDRNEFYKRNGITEYQPLDLVLMGHNPVKKVTIKGNRIWLDTKYSSGRFTILEVRKLIDIFKETNGK